MAAMLPSLQQHVLSVSQSVSQLVDQLLQGGCKPAAVRYERRFPTRPPHGPLHCPLPPFGRLLAGSSLQEWAWGKLDGTGSRHCIVLWPPAGGMSVSCVTPTWYPHCQDSSG